MGRLRYSIFVLLDDLLGLKVCCFFSSGLSQRVTVENGQDRLINYDTIKMYLIAHRMAN